MGKAIYNEGQKKAIVEKVLRRGKKSINDLATELGVSASALYRWQQKYANNQSMNQTTTKNTAEGKMQILKQYLSLPDDKKGEYIRSKGLYQAQIEGWISKPISLFDEELVPRESLLQEKKALLQEKEAHYQTQKDLQQKEKALAETVALLVLKKKLNDLLGIQKEP
jgi:transposase